jgi:hypothetical protein
MNNGVKDAIIGDGGCLKLMIDHSDIQMRWIDSAEKRRWMRSLAMLLEIIRDNSAILKTDREREEYNLVFARLKQEFESESLTWALDE